ncbi:MAG: DUF5819 family protein [Flavobacteriales bacterium]
MKFTANVFVSFLFSTIRMEYVYGAIMPETKSTYSLPLKVFVVAIVIALLGHFTLTIVYAFRENMPAALNQRTDRYMAPVFHQNWKLFAPDLPRYNCELEFRLAINNEWTDWKDASSFYGYDDYSSVETIEQNILTQLNWQLLNNLYTRNGVIQFDRIVRSTAYTDAMFMVMKMHRNAQPDKREEMMQIRIRYQFTSTPHKDDNHQEVIEFPIYAGENPI